MEKEAQNSNYTEYYQGQTPDYKPGGSIDYSQLSSVFSRTPETMELVYRYAPQISQDVSYIFDFSNQGAYGVYIPSLVEEVKSNELRQQLESRGYEIKEENGMLVAYPRDEKDDMQVKSEIKQLWDQINAGKSEVLGVNINKVKSSTEQQMRDIVNQASSAGAPISNPNLLWDMLIMLELGATVVHEWEHSRGGDEGAAQGREADFVSKMMETVRQKYFSESGEEMPVETMASTRNWYKFAQYLNYIPRNMRKQPLGSDLDGRMGRNPPAATSMADWGMMAQQNKSEPIENRLGRGFMWPLAKGLDQRNQSIEEQLRRQFATDEVPNVLMIHEELLSKDRDSSQGYKTLEQLMEERRPQPLMVPLEKTASRLKKEATLFGWYNNLEISDGSTIPGLGDRVMAWDDRDEDFAADETWIKEQPRYNPSYDIKGFYYRWIEPRFKPQLWDDMTNDLSNTHPAKRFAQVEKNIDTSGTQIIQILGIIKNRILTGQMRATRLVVTSDIFSWIKKIVECDGVRVKHFRFGKTVDEEPIYAVWVTESSIPVETLREAEKAFQAKTEDDVNDLVEELLGLSYYRAKVVKEIIQAAKRICSVIGIEDLYIVGTYAREIAMGNESPDVEQLDFSTSSTRMNSQIGNLLAKHLGVEFDIGEDLVFIYKGIKVEFSISVRKEELAQLSVFKVKRKDMVAIDILKRDFTVNMLAYNIITREIIDPFRVAKKSIRNGEIKTLFNARDLVSKNPIVILRALMLKQKYGMELDEDLERAMIINSPKLFKGKYSDFELLFARESIRSEGSEEADKLFNEFGLWKLIKMK